MKDLFNKEIKKYKIGSKYVFMQAVNDEIQVSTYTIDPEVWLSQYQSNMISKVAEACLIDMKVHVAFALYENHDTHYELVNYMEFKND
jgi:hypothetical protein